MMLVRDTGATGDPSQPKCDSTIALRICPVKQHHGHLLGADLRNDPGNAEDQRGAHRAGREQQRIDVPEPAQRAGLPAGQRRSGAP